jgi:hypothetical protein
MAARTTNIATSTSRLQAVLCRRLSSVGAVQVNTAG